MTTEHPLKQRTATPTRCIQILSQLSLLRRVHSLKHLGLAIGDHGSPQRLAGRILEEAGVDMGTLNQEVDA